MAKIDDFVKQQGQFLKAENVEKETSAFIIGEAVMVHNDKYDTDRLHIPVEVNKEPFTFDCSKTNARTIASKLSDDTKEWIGKILILEIYKTKTSDGKMVDAINVKEVKVE